MRNNSVVDGRKLCTRCAERKPVEEFSRRGGKTKYAHHLKSRCKVCDRTYEAERAKARGYERNRELWLMAAYGLTVAQYDALLYGQGGVCAVAGCCSDNGARPLVVDHCHKTVKVRGLLCDACNKALGLLQDDHARILALAAYLIR